MGMVLKAEHRRMERTVALKILSPAVTKNPDAVRRFQREVKAAAKLEHPNIVTAHDADEANGTHLDTKTADARADVYSLGVTLWYLLTGLAVYDGETVLKKLMAHQSNPVPSLCGVCPQVSPELEAVFAKMVAKAPGSRYQNMTEVIAALERCTCGSTSALPDVTAAGEDSRLNEFLRGVESSGGITVATKGAAVKRAASPATEPTVTLQSGQVETDPETQRQRPDEP